MKATSKNQPEETIDKREAGYKGYKNSFFDVYPFQQMI